MKRASTLLFALAACGGAQDPATTPGGVGGAAGGAEPGVAGDATHELPVFEVKGIVFQPEALGRPGMPMVAAKKKTTVQKQRTTVAAAKDPVVRQAQAAVLATMLYEQAKSLPEDQSKPLLTEARQTLRDAGAAAGKNIDELTLRLLGSYEIQLEDWAAAETAWAGYVAMTPKAKDAPYNRAWWAYSLLKQNKNAEALEVVKNEPLTEAQPELAYVTAWAKYRTNDDAGAWQAIAVAAKQWNGAREPLERDVFLFASRSSVSLAEVTPQLFSVFNAKQGGPQFDVLAKLGLTAYEYAGRWTEGVASLEKALAIAGATTPPAMLPVIRFKQADFTVRLDTPEVAAKYAKQAVEALVPCGKECSDDDKQGIVLRVAGIARLFHFLYATANDIRYYQPANDLYLLTIPLIMDAKQRAEYNTGAQNLQTTLKNTKVGTGIHDKEAVSIVVNTHLQEVQACYEARLVANPRLGGALAVTFEIETSGAVKGITTEPKAGLADVSAVAGCVAEAVKDWKFPKRGSEGTTRVTAKYNLTARK